MTVDERKERQGWVRPFLAPKCDNCKSVVYRHGLPRCEKGDFRTKITAWCNYYIRKYNIK